jgi:hypothetical protein
MAKSRESGDWKITRTPRGRARRGGGAPGPATVPDQFLHASGVSVADAFEATPPVVGARRAAGPPELVIDVDLKPGEAGVLAIRHPSGALTFHVGAPPVGRGRAKRLSSLRFQVPVRRVGSATGRRGIVGSALKGLVVKVSKAAVNKVIGIALPKLALAWETRTWKEEGLSEGWFHVTPTSGDLRLEPGRPEPGRRSLVLVHGTFSNAGSAFKALTHTDFFDRVAPLYGPRIFAFNHFSLSRTPAENAEQLLAGLPAGACQCDVITHSRGGLVFRSAIEDRVLHGDLADRLQLGQAVLVASPNEGTPLATPERWDQTVGWFANLMEMLPDNPFTTGAQFVSEAIVWLAGHVTGDIPGLRAMDGAGDFVAGLQEPPGPPLQAYSALVSNHHADDNVWERALDVGIDTFFATANDLVVPSEGGWRVDRDGTPYIPGDRIGCFGPGGNLGTTDGGPVTHVDFFKRPETAAFLVRALGGEPQSLRLVDPGVPLPDRRFTRVLRGAVPAVIPDARRPVAAPLAAPSTGVPLSMRPAAPLSMGPAIAGPPGFIQDRGDTDTFHIVIMDALESETPAVPHARRATGGEPSPVEARRPDFARVFASYGGARVTTPMRLRKGKSEQVTRFGRIIDTHERIKAYTNREQGSLPSDAEMVAFGTDLFETLFQGDVRRLYDEARSRQQRCRLDFVLTSMIPWIAEKPWEFAYDAGRRSFLATEDIHFVRNVLTAIPADVIPMRHGPLRILVAAAQPVGFGHLSITQEIEVIRRGFEPLIEAGFVSVDVLPRATPSSIHGRLSTGEFTIVHFIGHGVFNEATGEGALMFEDTRGGEVPLGERSVREIFCQRGLSLVFLNACQSGSGGQAEFNKGVAQALVSHGLPALVANQYSVLDSSATSFAQHFYWSLAQGMTVGQSAREARIAVNYSMQGELIDWAVPVVYARDPNMTICARPDTVSLVPATSTRATSRRATTGRPVRVAVWDIDDVFPSVDRTLQRMNAAQNVFGFELVDMSIPIDVWDLETRARDGTPYLKAEQLAHRLEAKTVELRANVLACVTRHWMRDEHRLNLFGWWPGNRKPPVVIFSCAGLDDLEAEGPDTDRVIANVTVTALAGFYGETGSHVKGAQDCPLFHNPRRKFKHLVAAQKFDPACRAKLKRKLPKELPALEALLKAFI